jgi:hypothetical protein
LPKTEISGQRCISADAYARKLCICRNDLAAIALYGVFFAGRLRNQAISAARGQARRRSGGHRDDFIPVISPKAPRANLSKAPGDC